MADSPGLLESTTTTVLSPGVNDNDGLWGVEGGNDKYMVPSCKCAYSPYTVGGLRWGLSSARV